MDITSIGDVNVDIVTSKLDRMPEEDSQKVVRDMTMTTGGCAANFALAAAKLGLQSRLIGKIGDDLFGNFVRESLKGVDCRLAKGTKTGITFAMTFDNATRSFITSPGANGEFGINDIDPHLIEGRYLHIASFFLQGLREETKSLMELAHDRRMLVSFDTGWNPANWLKKDINDVIGVLKNVDIFFPNLKEAQAITKLEEKGAICDSLLSMGPGIIGLKLGKRGCYIAKGRERLSIPPLQVDPVDTTGAGDVFNAAFIFGHSKGWGLKEIGMFANVAAAISTLAPGTTSYPTEEEVISTLKTNPPQFSLPLR